MSWLGRYISLLGIFYRAALLTEMEYRVNFIVSLAMSVGWSVWALAGITVFYFHRSQLGGWTYDEILMVVGLFVTFNGMVDAVLRPNIVRVVEYIQKGTLDFVLVKPANSQFLATITACSGLQAG